MIPIKDDNPTYTFPFVTIGIIAIDVLIYFYQLSLGVEGEETFIYRTAAIPYEVTNFVDTGPRGIVPPPFTLITAMFVHGGFFHLAGNMLYLWIFGDNIEDRLGHLNFFVFYLITGVAASFIHILADPASEVPMIGASGAIAGVLGAYFLLFPRAHVITLVFFFVTTVRIPALVFLGFWFLFQILNIPIGGGIAWYAHIGGFVAGAIGVFILKPKRWRRVF